MSNHDNDLSDVDENWQPVPSAIIRNRIADLDGPVTTQQLVDHLAAHGASIDELATVAVLPDREWADYNQALAAASSGFEPRRRRATDAAVSDHSDRAQ